MASPAETTEIVAFDRFDLRFVPRPWAFADANRAAIDARRNYIDVCDDPVPTLDMLAHDREAKAAGVTALIGLGASERPLDVLGDWLRRCAAGSRSPSTATRVCAPRPRWSHSGACVPRSRPTAP